MTVVSPVSASPTCSLVSPTWYECPIPITIFCIFLFLFIYSLVVTISLTHIITDKEFSEEKYGKSIREIMNIYILNLVVTFISLLVLAFFLYQLIPKDTAEGIFNEYFGMIMVFYIIIVSAWTISAFKGIQNMNKTGVNAVAGIALAFSLLAFVLYVIRLFLIKKVATQKGIPQSSVKLKDVKQYIKKKTSTKPKPATV